MDVIKRNGDLVSFNVEKIIAAIGKANASAGGLLDGETIAKIATSIEEEAKQSGKTFGVEEIQDKVELALTKVSYEVSKKYILYRDFRSKERNKKEKIIKSIQEKLECKNVENQNANVDEYSFGGRKWEASSVLNKKMALDYYLSLKAVKNHLENRIYQHDLDSYVVGMHNCLTIPFDDLLKKGFSVKQTDVRPAKSISTAFQLVAVVFQVQSLQQFGGVSASHLDWTMVPYVRKSFFKHYTDALEFKKGEKVAEKFKRDFSMSSSIEDESVYKDKKCRNIALKWTKRELQQSVEGMYHNLNTLQSRSGNQLPFTSINYGTCTLVEGQMVIEALLNGLLKGVGKLFKTPIFPCGIFQKMKGVNDKGSPNYYLYKLALKATSKRLYPNYVNCNWSGDTDLFDVVTKKKFLESLIDAQRKQLLVILRTRKELQDVFGLEIKKTYKVPVHFNFFKKVFGRNNVVEVGEEVVPMEFIPSCIPSTMGCRTYTSKDVNWEEEWKNDLLKVLDNIEYVPHTFASSHQKDGRGNICPATIVMPTLAMEAKEVVREKLKVERNKDLIISSLDEFLKILEQAIEDCKDSLLERYKWICSQSPKSAKFMWNNNVFVGYIPEEGLHSAFRHGSLAIGQIGLAETLQILIGKNHLDKESLKIAQKIESLFQKKCLEYKKQYSLNFGVYYTPAENLCYTAMKEFKKKYGVIEGVSDRDYFTNSIHVPVWEEISPFEKIQVESKLTGYSSAGCITYIELDANASHNLKALEQLVDFAMVADIPYFAINVPSDTCLHCGFIGEVENACPACGETKEIERLRRVTGYLTGDYISAFNAGKVAEVHDRYKHSNLMTGWGK